MLGNITKIKDKTIISNTLGDIAGTLQVIAQVYKDKNDIDSALKIYKQALRIRNLQPQSNKNSIAMLSDYIGMLYFQKGDYEDALKVFNTSLDLRRKI